MTKYLVILLGLATSTQICAANTINHISCSKITSGSVEKVIDIERIEANDDASYSATYFFQSLKNNLRCLIDKANRPTVVKCENLNSLDPAISLSVFGSDGVLNLGMMTIDNQKSQLRCSGR